MTVISTPLPNREPLPTPAVPGRLLLRGAWALTALMMALTGGAPAAATAESAPRRGLLSAVYVYDGNRAKYRDADAGSIDQMFYAFALFKDGSLSTAHWKNIKAFKAYIGKHPHITPILSIGGWGAEGFSQAASTPEGRAAFVADALRLMAEHGFLGVDIDWEYPGSSAAGIISSPADRENYTLLLAALREALDELTAADGTPRRLCIALSSSPELIENLQCAQIGALVDQVNLMTYDMQQQAVASHHSALFASAPDAPSAAASVQAYVRAGIPAAKLMLGAAFYGYRWRTKEVEPLNQAAAMQGSITFTAIDKLARKRPEAVRFDEAAQAPYYADGKVFISYDDARSIAAKGLFAQAEGLLGLFAWEYGGDATGQLAQALGNSR